MTFQPLRHPALPVIGAFLALGLVVAIGGARETRPAAQIPAAPPVEAVRLDTPEVIELQPGDAQRQAIALRDKVAVSLAEGLELRLWAAEPLLHDPIALDVDGQGRVYVTQTTRRPEPGSRHPAAPRLDDPVARVQDGGGPARVPPAHAGP